MSTIRTMRMWPAALLLPVLAACGIGDGGDVLNIEAVAVERGDLIVTASSTGVLEPVLEVEVTSKASGEILRLHVDVGDEIEPGALLAEIDPRDVRNVADQADADIEVARARMDIAERQVESRKLRHRVFGDFVPQTLQTNLDHYMLEPRRRRGALYRPHGRALSG